jgi:hypothetical protein
VTNRFEREVGERLRSRVANLPTSYEVDTSTLVRARRRRLAKLGALASAIVVVAAGTAAGLARSVDRSSPRHFVSAEGERASVETVRCPIKYDLTPPSPLPPPSAGPREVTVRGADAFVSYAATTDERYVVLGPKGWTCSAEVAADGSNGFGVAPPGPTGAGRGAINIGNDFLWHGGVGSPVACSVSDDPAVRSYIEANFPVFGPCPKAGRTLTRVDAHVTTFVDADGARGAAWIVLPSSGKGDDGKISVLTCEPGSGLTATDCGVIIADWVARVRKMPDTTSTASTNLVPAFGCEGTGTVGSDLAPLKPVAGAPALFHTLASFLANVDGDPRFRVLGPRGWSCRFVQYEDGRAAIIVFDPVSGVAPREEAASLSIDVDWLWHGLVGTSTACSVFDTPAVVQMIDQLDPSRPRCPQLGRTVTRVGVRAATFVDSDGTRGAAWILLPSGQGADGRIDLLTCRPTSELSAAQCDTIAADYAVRANAPVAPR